MGELGWDCIWSTFTNLSEIGLETASRTPETTLFRQDERLYWLIDNGQRGESLDLRRIFEVNQQILVTDSTEAGEIQGRDCDKVNVYPQVKEDR